MSSALTKKVPAPAARGARDHLAEVSQARGSQVRETVLDLAESTRENFKNAPAAATIGHRPSRAIPVNAVSSTLLFYQFGMAGFAHSVGAIITNPVDVTRARMQMSGQAGGVVYRSTYDCARRIIMREGFFGGWYAGLTPALMREVSYSGCRLGLYEPTKFAVQRLEGRTDAPFHTKIAAAILTATVGSVVANPCDVVKLRMQLVGMCGEPKVGPYATSTVSAFRAAVKDTGGVLNLWRLGCMANIQRNSLATASQIPVYDHSKKFLVKKYQFVDGPPLHAICCLVAGVTHACITSPIDLAKARIMTSNAQPPLSPLNMLKQIVKTEGPLALFKGFNTQWLRIGPHCFFTLMTFEQLRRAVGMQYL